MRILCKLFCFCLSFQAFFFLPLIRGPNLIKRFLGFACAGSLDGKPHGYPFASAAAIDLQVKNRIVKTVFLLQAACYHNVLLFYNR